MVLQGITWGWFTTGWLKMKPRRTLLSVSKVLTSLNMTFLSGFLIHSIHLPIHSLIRQSIPSFVIPFHSLICQFIPSFAKPFHLMPNPLPHLPMYSLNRQSIPFDAQSITTFTNIFPWGWSSGLSYYLLLELTRSFSTSWTSTPMLQRFYSLTKLSQFFFNFLSLSSIFSVCVQIFSVFPQLSQFFFRFLSSSSTFSICLQLTQFFLTFS